ncbi:MAG: hypothetical protein L0387_41580 [Acidobacteria bacterium]|nr:hypothetical protein [Acidobacteriota bacterium]MCI0628081.1 hypothetical protein [Acidobacteriota bacterium]MCI0720991.1 hypothetical protein [Acidobacteriota bacterium]
MSPHIGTNRFRERRDGPNECFHDDAEASSLLHREYRLPFVIPEKV